MMPSDVCILQNSKMIALNFCRPSSDSVVVNLVSRSRQEKVRFFEVSTMPQGQMSISMWRVFPFASLETFTITFTTKP